MEMDIGEIARRLFKCLIEGFAVGLAAALIPRKGKMDMDEIVLVGVIAAAVFAVLDVFAPAVSFSVRQGAGLGLGFGVVGGVPTA